MEDFLKKNLGKILLIVLPIVVVLILLYPTWNASQLENLENEAKARASKAKNSEDSLKIMNEFKDRYDKDLTSAKKSRLKLGLDLRGGMYVTMEVDVVKLIEGAAASESVDEVFLEVIQKTTADQEVSDEATIDIFLRNFYAIARPKGKTLLNYFEPTDYRDMSEEKIIEKLKTDVDAALNQAQEVIKQRIDQYGVSEPNIQKIGTSRIVLELPGVQNRNDMMSLLQTTARLEFNLVRNNESIVKVFAKIDKYLSNLEKKNQGFVTEEIFNDSKISDTAKVDTALAKNDTTATTTSDTNNPYAGLSEEEAFKRYSADHPFTRLFSTRYYQGTDDRQQPQPISYIGDEFPEGEYIFSIPADSMARFNILLKNPDIAKLIPVDVKIAIDAKPDQQTLKTQNAEIFDFYCLKKDPELTGEVVTNAVATFNPMNKLPVVSMSMDANGTENWARITGANLKKRIAIVLDDRVHSAPTVQNKITGGNSEITGMANTEEAHLLEIVLKAGALKAPIKIAEERIVGPSLGEDSINSGLWSTVGAAIAVILFMLIYYSIAGFTADIAVIINVGLILAALATLGGTLTLPGIAGIILTMGMAVDANVLIYERIREEIAKGRSIRAAIDEGFAKAMSAILDSNITTLISGVILYYVGTGPIQGFALTLMIGILGTLFTAIFVTKAIIELIISNSKSGFMSFGQSKTII